MGKCPIYLPIELQDVFELIEKDELENLYFENGDFLQKVDSIGWKFNLIVKTNFYVKQEYTPIKDQEVGNFGYD